MKNWIRKNRILIISTSIMLLSVAIAGLLYRLFGHKFIEAMYTGASPISIDLLTTYPLEYYFRMADIYFRAISLLGLTAAICIFLFGLWVRHISAKKILMTALVLLLLLIFNAVRIDILSFENGAKKLVKRSGILSEKARVFDEKKILTDLGMNNINGFYYRFDERIKDATCENTANDGVKIQKKSEAADFEFTSGEAIKFKLKKGECILEDGLLKFSYTRGDCLENIEDLNIPKDAIGEIELKIKLKKSKIINLGWSKYNYARWADTEKIGSIAINTVPDNAFNTYRISVENALKRGLNYGDIIKKVFLTLPNSDKVEIDYIRFIPKREKYTKKLYGETYETINKEMRKVLYTDTPLCLRYPVDIPQGRTFLRFGMGILEENDPVTFRITVKYKNSQKEILSKKVIDTAKWQDAGIELSEWSGKRVEILFEAESEYGNIAFWSNPIIYTSPKERFNVIIVLEDALRPDHMSCYGYLRQTTPVKDRFIKDGVLFLNAFSQETKTRPSCPSIMTSLFPTATGVWNPTDMLDEKYLTLAEIMRSQGFLTASFIQNGNAGPSVGLHQGFSELFDAETTGTRAEQIYGKLYGWLEKNLDRNFFLYLHLMDPHGPYNPPQPFDAWYRETPFSKNTSVERDTIHHDPEWVERPTLEGRRLLYDGEIRYNDYCFEEFLEKLKKYNLSNDTLVIFISDHGEHLGEHDLWEHRPPGYIQVVRIPMLMVFPKKLPKKTEIIQPVQAIDIMPTILDFANIEKDKFLLQGDSLISLIKRERLSFWDNRLCISEEVYDKSKNDKNEWASIFYKNWHIINSKHFLCLSLVSKMLFKTENFPELALGTRVFNYLKDKDEGCYLNSFLVDIFFKYRFKHLVRKLQENNMEIWRAFTKGTAKTIKYNPEELKRLRSMGYLQ